MEGRRVPGAARATRSRSAAAILALLSLTMKDNSSATVLAAPPLSRSRAGLWWGLLGVVAFSFTLPLTRIAVDGMSALLIGAGRAAIAAVLAGIALAATRQRPPTRSQWRRLALVAAGVVAGFGLLTSFALEHTSASHGAVVVALLPAATAAMTVLRTGEHPPRRFWIAAGAGAVAAVAFAALGNGGLGSLGWPDLLLFAAVAAAAVGYTEGACSRANSARGRRSRGRWSSAPPSWSPRRPSHSPPSRCPPRRSSGERSRTSRR
nr:hypothetical protein GCM10025732_00720 [Glycomyces mayteni]